MDSQFQEFEMRLMQALEASMNPNGEIRKAAEQYINDNQRTPGYVIALANISANKQVNY
jgi:galactokinase